MWPAGLDRNGYDKSKCTQEFEAYKSCKMREVCPKRSLLCTLGKPQTQGAIMCLWLQGDSRLQRRLEAQKGKGK